VAPAASLPMGRGLRTAAVKVRAGVWGTRQRLVDRGPGAKAKEMASTVR